MTLRWHPLLTDKREMLVIFATHEAKRVGNCQPQCRDDGRATACAFKTWRPRRNEQHFADDIYKRIFFNENVWISIKISLKFVPKGPISNIPALVQIMAWRRSGDKPLSETMMVNLPTHMCVTRPQIVEGYSSNIIWSHISCVKLRIMEIRQKSRPELNCSCKHTRNSNATSQRSTKSQFVKMGNDPTKSGVILMSIVNKHPRSYVFSYPVCTMYREINIYGLWIFCVHINK